LRGLLRGRILLLAEGIAVLADDSAAPSNKLLLGALGLLLCIC